MSGERVAVVTGGGTGIGLATAKALARAGFEVLVAGRRERVLAEACEQIASERPAGRATYLTTDVARPDQCQRLIDHAVSSLGGLDVLVCNAGIVDMAPFAELTAEQWDASSNVMLRGPALLSAAAVRHMREHDGGRIVLISSVDALTPEPELAHYGAAKAAVSSLARSIVLDHGREGIVANAVGPGWVRTPMTDEILAELTEADLSRINPVGRVAEPEEIANLVAYLAIDAPTFLTGATIFIDGGQTALPPLP